MTQQLNIEPRTAWEAAISPWREMIAYEALWLRKGMTFKRVADIFRENPSIRLSETVTGSELLEAEQKLTKLLKDKKVEGLGVRLQGSAEYPEKLVDAQNPLQLFYYQGWWDLAYSRSVAVVGARKVSDEGKRRTRKLVQGLVKDGFTVVSGLAEGVDTTAHNSALEFGGKTFAVIGTPLSDIYPKSNRQLQEQIRDQYLIISQVPFLRYQQQDYRSNRSFFPERNITMSAMTEATIIVEASDTSGTLYQARAAINQGRKLFILDNCFRNPNISWPERFEKKGAIRVKDYSEIKDWLES